MNKVKVDVIRLEDGVFTAVLKGVPVEVANSLRRIIMSEVRTIAIEDVYIFRNDSILNDDSLAHRLGLIPLKASRDKIKSLLSGGDSPDYVTLVLKVSSGKDYRTVYSRDIKSRDRLVKPIYGDIEIVKLAPGQGIEIEMWAKVGRGRDHAKWSPVSVAVVRGVPRIRMAKNIPPDIAEAIKKVCPKDVFEVVDGKLKVADLYRCTVCLLCEKEYPDYVKVGIDESSSILHFESIGQLTIKEIIEEAFDIMIGKLKEFRDRVGEVTIDAV